jgi:hypothetical protein
VRRREVRTLLRDRRLGLLPEDRRSALDEHVAGCDACSLERRFEWELAAGLASLRDSSPPEIDVTARVMTAVAAEPVPQPARTRRRLFLAAAAAAVPVAVLLSLLLPQVPSLGDVAILAKNMIVAAGSGFVRMFGLLAPLAHALASFVRPLGLLLAAVAPAAQAATTICLVAMAAVTIAVLRRDWTRPLARKEIE